MSLGAAARGPNLNQLVDKCIAEADSIVSGNAISTQPKSDCMLLRHLTLYVQHLFQMCNNSPVLQIFCTHSEPNFSLPWQRKRQYSSTSSGFITDGKRILTNAHCVDHHTQVRHRFQPSCLSQGTALSVHSAFRLVSMHSFFSAFSLQACLRHSFFTALRFQACLNAQLLMHSAFVLVSRHSFFIAFRFQARLAA